MGLFDAIMLDQACPACGKWGSMEAQTKDLDCFMHYYRTLADDWETSKLGRTFRAGLPMSHKFPLDKSASVWKDQAEYMEAEATIPEVFHGKLNYVEVVADCPSCRVSFRGRIAIREGRLRGDIYGIVQEGK